MTGWVANRRDGAVEAVFEGEPEEVERLVDFCRRGPRGARVDDVDVADEEPEGMGGYEVAVSPPRGTTRLPTEA